MGVGILIAPDKEAADDGSDDAGSGQDQGEQSAGAVEGACHGHAQRQSGNQSAHIGLEQVGAHAGHVAHVVAHIIGDDGGVPGIVFGDTGLDLAHQISAYVSGLGVDTAAYTGEQSDGGSTQREAGEDLNVAGKGIDGGAAQQTQTNHAHTHNGTAGECNAQRLVHAAGLGGGSSADVGLGSHIHAHRSGAHGEHGTYQKADGGEPADKQADQYKQNGHKDHQNLVLGEQECPCAIADIACDFLHPFRTCVSLGNRGGFPCGKQQSQNCTQQGDPNDVFHFFHSLTNFAGEYFPLLYHFTNEGTIFQVNLLNRLYDLTKFYVLTKNYFEMP